MVCMRDIRNRRDEILQIAEKHGADNLRIFGSVARGQAEEASDLDILVHLEESRSLLDHIALKHDMEDLLGCVVDVVDDDAIYEDLRGQVLAESVPL